MLPDCVSNPGPLTYELGTLPNLSVVKKINYCSFAQQIAT